MQKKRRKRRKPKRVLRLPDLALAKAAVVNSLSSEGAKRSYDHAITEFVDWYYIAVGGLRRELEEGPGDRRRRRKTHSVPVSAEADRAIQSRLPGLRRGQPLSPRRVSAMNGRKRTNTPTPDTQHTPMMSAAEE